MIDATCAWVGCDSRKVVARGLCNTCYRRASRAGMLDSFRSPDRVCPVCESTFEVSSFRRTHCSKECTRRHSTPGFRRARLEAIAGRECSFCLEPIPERRRRDARYCSIECQQAKWYLDNAADRREATRRWNAENDGLRRGYRHARRARMYAAEYETFDVWEIAERDLWECGICHERVDAELEYPDPMSKSLDHVIPLSRGGSHTRANASVTHLLCNIKKKDRIERPDQGVTSPSAVAS